MEDLTTDMLEGDAEYAIQAIRTYIHGGGHLSAGWALALLEEIERLRADVLDMNAALRAAERKEDFRYSDLLGALEAVITRYGWGHNANDKEMQQARDVVARARD